MSVGSAVGPSYPRMSRMSSWLAAWPASLLRRMERGVVGGDVSHRMVALSSWADCSTHMQHVRVNGDGLPVSLYTLSLFLLLQSRDKTQTVWDTWLQPGPVCNRVMW